LCFTATVAAVEREDGMLPWTKTHRTSGQTGKRKRESASANGDRVMPSDDRKVKKIAWDKKSHWNSYLLVGILIN